MFVRMLLGRLNDFVMLIHFFLVNFDSRDTIQSSFMLTTFEIQIAIGPTEINKNKSHPNLYNRSVVISAVELGPWNAMLSFISCTHRLVPSNCHQRLSKSNTSRDTITKFFMAGWNVRDCEAMYL